MKLEDLQNHGINTEIVKIKDFYVLKKQELFEEEQVKPEVETIFRLSQRIEKVLAVADSNLVAVTTLNTLSSHLSTAFSNLKNFLASSTESNLLNFNNSINNLANYIAILSVSKPINGDEIFDRISLMKRNLTLLENFYNEKNDNIETQINEKQVSIKEVYDQSNAKILKLEQQLERLKDSMQIQENEIEKYKTTIKTYFDEKNASFTNLFTQMKSEKENELVKLSSKFEKQYKENYEKFANIHSKFIDEATNKADQLDKLVNIAGQNGAKAPYVEAAENEMKSSKFWRFISMVSMIVFVFISIAIAINFKDYFEPSLEWYSYIGRFFILTGIATIVAYSSKIASKHKENHRYYRQMALELSSIFLFLSTLSDSEVNNIKKDLVDKYYANLENPNNRRDDEGISENTMKRLQKYIEIFSQIKK